MQLLSTIKIKTLCQNVEVKRGGQCCTFPWCLFYLRFIYCDAVMVLDFPTAIQYCKKILGIETIYSFQYRYVTKFGFFWHVYLLNVALWNWNLCWLGQLWQHLSKTTDDHSFHNGRIYRSTVASDRTGCIWVDVPPTCNVYTSVQRPGCPTRSGSWCAPRPFIWSHLKRKREREAFSS